VNAARTRPVRRIAASRKLFGRFSGVVLAAGRRIDNPPQVANLPHKKEGIVIIRSPKLSAPRLVKHPFWAAAAFCRAILPQ
jgi:hypothetical protein